MRPIYIGIIQKLHIALLRVLTGGVVDLEKHQLAALLPRVEDISWNIQPDLGSNNGPVSANVESIDVSHTLVNTKT